MLLLQAFGLALLYLCVVGLLLYLVGLLFEHLTARPILIGCILGGMLLCFVTAMCYAILLDQQNKELLEQTIEDKD